MKWPLLTPEEEREFHKIYRNSFAARCQILGEALKELWVAVKAIFRRKEQP